MIAILNDITRIKELESQSYKMRSIFFASVAHELRTPLNTIIPLSNKLMRLVNDPHSLKLVKVVRNTSMYLQNLIEDALDMSRLDSGKF